MKTINKRNLLLTVTSIMMSLNVAFTQAPAIEWQKSYGGTAWEWASCIQQTSDFGYIVAGSTESNDIDVAGNHGSVDYWIIKLDTAQAIQWQKTLGGSSLDEISSMIQTSDGGYIVAGSSRSSDGDVMGNHGGWADYWIVKLDNAGTILWQKCLGGSGHDRPNAIEQTADNGYIIVGYSNLNSGDVSGNHGGNDYWIVKLDVNGVIQWQKSYGGSQDDIATSVKQTGDGGFIIAGYALSNNGNVTGNHGIYDYWILKLNSNGVLQWQKTYGGSSDEYPSSIFKTSDGGFIIAGSSRSNDGDVSGNHGGTDTWLVKIDFSGTLQWQKTYGGSSDDGGGSIQQTVDGGYIVSNTSYSNDGDVSGHHAGLWINPDCWAFKTDINGMLSWQKSLGGSKDDYASKIIQTVDNGFVMSGSSFSNDGDLTNNNGISDFWIVKLSKECSLPTIPSSISVSGGIPKVCTGDSRIYTTGADTGVVFNWVVPTGVAINNGQGTHSINVTYTSNFSVSGDISVTKVNACGNSAARNLTVMRKVPSMPYYISIQGGSNGVCIGDVRTYSTKPDTAVTFNWTVPAGAVINNGQGTNSIEVTFINNISANGAVISVVKVNSCGNTSAPRNLYIQRKLPFVPHSISTLGGSAKVCPGDVKIYNTSSTTAVSFYWTVPNGAVITSGQGTSSINVMYNNYFIADGVISVAGVNSCGIGSPRSLIVKRNLPIRPYAVLGTSEVCPGSTETYTVQYPAYPNSYNWVVPTGATINSGQGTSSIQVTFNNSFNTNSIISVQAVNTCGSSYPYYYTINKNMPSIPSAISGTKFGLCGGRDVVYSVQQVQGMTYNWTVPGLANITSGQGTNSITVNFQSVNFQKTITVTASNTCGTSVVRSLTIRSAPEKPGIISGPLSVCANSTGNTYSILPDTSATDYTWTGPTGSLISANGVTSTNNVLTTTASSVLVDFGNITSTSSVRVRANNTCGSSANNSLLLTPCSTTLSCAVSIDFDNTECGWNCNGTTTASAIGGIGPYSYEWFNSLGESVQTTQTAVALCSDTYTVIVTDNNGSTSSCNTTIGGGTAFTLPTFHEVDLMFSGFCPPYCNGYINVIPSIGSLQDYTYQWNTGATTNMITDLCGYSNGGPSGEYTITVWDSTGCAQSEYYFMENHISFISLGCETTIDESYPGAADGAIHASVWHGTGPFSFLWSNGQTGSTATGLTAGTYTVTATGYTGCSAVTSCIVVTLSPRLEETLLVKQITARPNPFTNVLNLEIITDENLIVTIRDVAGRDLIILPNVNSSFSIDRILSAGIYYITAENESGTYKKVLKVVRTN